jgi:hypothetical protein
VISRSFLSAGWVVAGLSLVACGGEATQKAAAPTGPKMATNLGASDQSRCDYKGRADRESIESEGPGAMQPNIRRVFGIMGEGDDRRRVLFCREIDTNLDGVKDVVRTYNDKGDALEEEADSNYDGKVDTWIRFAGGRISKVEIDHNGDGLPDETRFYVKGVLSRAQRDTNYDGKPDVWEVYSDGELERIGVDLDFDGHVDRWDRDEVAHRVAEEKERADEEKEAAKKAEEAPPAAANGATPAAGAKPDAKGGKPDTTGASPAKPDATGTTAGKTPAGSSTTPPTSASGKKTTGKAGAKTPENKNLDLP